VLWSQRADIRHQRRAGKHLAWWNETREVACRRGSKGGATGILYRGEREIESRACIGAACGPEAVLRWLVVDGAARRGDECC
jgi:hypothetical protein